MAAAAATRPSPPYPAIAPVGAYDRVFYGGMAVALALTVFSGFAPTYYPGFLAIPIFDMVVFSALVATALAMRRDKETHKRLMLLAFISIVVAAVARLPGMLPRGPLAFFGAGYLFIVVAVVYDLVSRRRVHKAYLWGG